jgi:hypothetical protein
MYVAADIDHSSREECDYLLEEPCIASLSRRIHNQCRLIPCPLEILGNRIEQSLRSTGMEFDIGNRVDGRIMVGIGD